MDPYRDPRAFDPLDLEIIDRVYEASWALVEANDPACDRERDDERQEALRKLIFAFADTGNVDFDDLYASVTENMSKAWAIYAGSVPSETQGLPDPKETAPDARPEAAKVGYHPPPD